MAEVLALASAISSLPGRAPSIRCTATMRPPSLRMAITTSHLLRVASASAAAISFLASSSVSAGFIRIRVFPLVPLVSSLGRGPKRSSVEALGERFVQNLLGLSRDTGDDLAGGENVVDEAGILS